MKRIHRTRDPAAHHMLAPKVYPRLPANNRELECGRLTSYILSTPHMRDDGHVYEVMLCSTALQSALCKEDGSAVRCRRCLLRSLNRSEREEAHVPSAHGAHTSLLQRALVDAVR